MTIGKGLRVKPAMTGLWRQALADEGGKRPGCIPATSLWKRFPEASRGLFDRLFTGTEKHLNCFFLLGEIPLLRNV
ncbi:MAG: hypothetical protein LBH19_05395, partial [Dysgonamonadaceae bacterium]|nr:hypothetical protein [Dysgonamonadaceae bacterium]